MPEVILNKKWDFKTLDELGFVGRGKSKHRPRDAAHLFGGNYPFIQTGDVKHSNLFIRSYSQTYSDSGLAQSKLWKAGTLCITIAANIADTAILGIDACFPDSVIGFIADDTKADTLYVKYLFDILQVQYQRFTQGAAQDNLSQEKLLSMRFTIPALSVQKQIAEALSNYDLLIENNLRRIELLENAARLIYKEWFVKLKFPGHEHTKIVNGVPEGWEKKPIGEIAPFNYGKALKADDRIEGQYPVYGSSGIVGTHEKPLVEGPAIIVGRKGNVGSIYWSFTDFFPIDTVYYIEKGHSDFYLYFTLKHVSFINSDVAVPGLNRTYAHSVEIKVASKNLRRQFNEHVDTIYSQIRILSLKNEKLRQARDILLPKLMTGEITV